MQKMDDDDLFEGCDLDCAAAGVPARALHLTDSVNGLRGEVTLVAVRAMDDRDVFDQDQVVALAVTLGDLPDEDSLFPAVIAKHSWAQIV